MGLANQVEAINPGFHKILLNQILEDCLGENVTKEGGREEGCVS